MIGVLLFVMYWCMKGVKVFLEVWRFIMGIVVGWFLGMLIVFFRINCGVWLRFLE